MQRNAQEGLFPAWLRSLNDRNYSFSKWQEASLRPPRPQPDRMAREAARKRKRFSSGALSSPDGTGSRDCTAAGLDGTDPGHGILPSGPSANGNAPVGPVSGGADVDEVRQVPEGGPGGAGVEGTDRGLCEGAVPPGRPDGALEGLGGEVPVLQQGEEGRSCLGTLQNGRHAEVSEA